MDNNTGLYLNSILAFMSKKIVVPTSFHNQAKAIKEMLSDDVSGIVDSLTDFAVDTATVDFHIETDNDQLTKIYNTWLNSLNAEYKGKIPSGIKPLAKEYFKERWKGASFPVLKIAKWSPTVVDSGSLILPSKMFFVDGGSIYAEDKDGDSQCLSIDQYDYFLGCSRKKDAKLDKNVIFTRPNGRWYDKYPNPFLIRRGVYHNWQIINSLKNNEIDLLDQVIPYILWIKKGTEKLAIDRKINYSDEKLQGVIKQMEDLINKSKIGNTKGSDGQTSTPVRASQFDEDIQHLIPDVEALFKSSLFEVAERNVLSGLGFIDVVDAVSSTRKESVLNPKAFIQEVVTGIEDFKQLIKELILQINEVNSSHVKYKNVPYRVTSSPIKGFMTDKFKQMIRSLWDRGLVSSKTATELIGELDFEVEVKRREEEAKQGIDHVMYPHLADNREGVGMDVEGIDGKTIPDDKIDPVEKKNFDKASLVNKFEDDNELMGSPFDSVKDLPKSVSDKIKSLKQKRKWLSIFNNAFNFYKGKFGDMKRAEALAFATAWDRVNKKSKGVKSNDNIKK